MRKGNVTGKSIEKDGHLRCPLLRTPIQMFTGVKEPRPKGYADKQYEDDGVYQGISYRAEVEDRSSWSNSAEVYHSTIALYGMPSGHSSAVWFSTIFLWLVKKSPYLLILELAICFNTMYQRWSFRKHSIEQIAVGGSIALTAFALTKQAFR